MVVPQIWSTWLNLLNYPGAQEVLWTGSLDFQEAFTTVTESARKRNRKGWREAEKTEEPDAREESLFQQTHIAAQM